MLGIRIPPRDVDELPFVAIEKRNQQKIDRISKPVLPEVTNNSQALECVVECWKTQEGEDSGDIKALKTAVEEKKKEQMPFFDT